MDANKIWDDFKKGSKSALSYIYYQHVQLLYRYGKKFTPDSEIVMDTIQDLFCDLIRTRNKLGDTDNIKFYLIKSFRRKLFRNMDRQRERLNPDFIRNEPLITYSAEEEMVEREELSQREALIQQALKELTPRMREILYYRYTCEFEYEHICDVMGIQYDSARKMVHRAVRELKNILSDNRIISLYTCFFLKK